MKKLFAWFLILVILGSLTRVALSYFLEEQSFKTYTKEQDYTVMVYFPNNIKDPKQTVCDLVFPIERTIPASKVGIPFHTLEALFEGPTGTEREAGYYSAIPDTAILAFFAITPEVIELVIDYDKSRLDPCVQTLMEVQIDKTLGQFNINLPIEINPKYLIETIFVK